jgi:hypothetical protein
MKDDHKGAIEVSVIFHEGQRMFAVPKQPAPVQEPVAYRQTGWAAHRDQYAVPVLFNPYTGQPRDVRDVQSDPQGILIVPPGKIEMLAAKPTHQQGLQVDAPPAAQPAVPDAFGTREGEHPQYIQGWNDCRAEMLRARENT